VNLNNNIFNHNDFAELKIIISSISLIINKKPSFHLNKEEWLKAFSACNLDKLLKLAHFHGVVTWLAEYLKECDVSEGDELSKRVKKITTQSKVLYLQSQYQLDTADHICRIFQQNNIEHLSFKGVAALKQFYNGYISTRVADDLDLLVNVEDLPKATTLLIENGYLSRENVDVISTAGFIARHAKSYRWRDLGFITTQAPKHKIDLHWLLADTFSLPADTSSLIKNSVLASDDSTIKTLPFTTHFVYLCVHGYADYFFRMRNLVDIYAATHQPQFDHNAITSCAKKYGVLEQVNESIQLANSFFTQQSSYSNSKFEALVFDNYSKNIGWTTRAHPNKAKWSRKDKCLHLLRQIKHRSRRSFWFSPILARTKFDINDAHEWNGEALPFYRLKCLLRKALK